MFSYVEAFFASNSTLSQATTDQDSSEEELEQNSQTLMQLKSPRNSTSTKVDFEAVMAAQATKPELKPKLEHEQERRAREVVEQQENHPSSSSSSTSSISSSSDTSTDSTIVERGTWGKRKSGGWLEKPPQKRTLKLNVGTRSTVQHAGVTSASFREYIERAGALHPPARDSTGNAIDEEENGGGRNDSRVQEMLMEVDFENPYIVEEKSSRIARLEKNKGAQRELWNWVQRVSRVRQTSWSDWEDAIEIVDDPNWLKMVSGD